MAMNRHRVLLLPDEPLLYRRLVEAENALQALTFMEGKPTPDAQMDTPLVFPAPLHYEKAFHAFEHVVESAWPQLNAHDDDEPEPDRGPWLLAAKDRAQLTPIRRVDVAVEDLTRIDEAVVLCLRAITAHNTDAHDGAVQDAEVGDVSLALRVIAADPHSVTGGRSTPEALVAAMARAASVLTLSNDRDTTVLGKLVENQTEDLVLSVDQEAAHQRLTARWAVLLTEPDPLTRYAS